MLRSRSFFFIGCLLSGLFCGGHAVAHEAYAPVSWPNLVRTLVRFNAITLDTFNLLDDYAIITECDLYRAYYGDEFKWNRVRKAVRASAEADKASFPHNYYIDVKMQLDRYDFEEKLFRFTPKTALPGVNTFSLFDAKGNGCGYDQIKYLPRSFRAVLPSILKLEGLPLSENDAQALLSRMTTAHNTDRLVYARYNFRVLYIEPLRRMDDVSSGTTKTVRYEQSSTKTNKGVRFDAVLDSIDFYEDIDMTKPFYHYKSDGQRAKPL